MLVTNQRLDQLAAARSDFIDRDMLDKSLVATAPALAQGRCEPAMAAPPQIPILDEDPMDEVVTELNALAEVKLAGRRKWTWSLSKAEDKLELPLLPVMIRRFLYDQLYPDSEIPSNLLETTAYPAFNGNIAIFYSALATIRAPSDSHGVNGMRREYIRVTYLGEEERFDTTACS